MRAIPKSAAFLVALGAAALAGVTVGAMTAGPSPTAPPTIPVAAIPTSTLDLRPPAPTQTLTPTQRPASPIVTPRPTPTPEPRGRAVVFFASASGAPIAVAEPKAAGGQSQSDHVFFRLAALRTTKVAGPPAYVNLFPTLKAAFMETTVASPGVVSVGFIVGEMYGDWGISPAEVKLLLQQIVFTATEEPGIDRVLITQNGAKPAVIDGITYDKALGREDVR
ncbi:MAG: GerMN domain-containing protein [Elusimicrobia bacterium]|nr:GerMN domain-containing protein [Elusimicrobiota bacterium]